MTQSITDHLKSRYFDIDLHPAWISEGCRSATFPIWNLSGELVGYQIYRPDSDKKKKNDPREGRYFTRIKDKKVGVWGLESWKFSNTLFITEGVFDTCRITSLGYSALALFSYKVSPSTLAWLRIIKASRPVVAVCDNDTSGLKLASLGHASITTDSGDLGDASEEYVKNMLTHYK